jgi:hypothetical protein
MRGKQGGLAEDMLCAGWVFKEFYMKFLKPANYAPEPANYSRSLALPCFAD